MSNQVTYDNIIVAGSISFDIIMDFPSRFVNYLQPDKLHQINVSFVVDKLEKQFGGTGTNIAYSASFILKDKVTLVASVGKDGIGLLKFLRAHKINTKGILTDTSLYTATGTVITDLNDNQIWGFYYGACEKAKELETKKFIKGKPLMIISANHPKAFLHFQKDAIKYKVDYLYDPGMALTWITDKELSDGIVHCKYLIGNDYEISAITKRIKKSVKELVKMGKIVITTLGENGVTYNDANTEITVTAYGMKKVVDPTGAGDAWRGGFMSGVVNGWDVKDCLKLGNVMASFAVEKYGTVNHNPTMKEIERRLKGI